MVVQLHEVLDEAVYSLSGGVRLVSPDPSVIAGIEPKQKAYEKYALDEVRVTGTPMQLLMVPVAGCGESPSEYSEGLVRSDRKHPQRR